MAKKTAECPKCGKTIEAEDEETLRQKMEEHAEGEHGESMTESQIEKMMVQKGPDQ